MKQSPRFGIGILKQEAPPHTVEQHCRNYGIESSPSVETLSSYTVNKQLSNACISLPASALSKVHSRPDSSRGWSVSLKFTTKMYSMNCPISHCTELVQSTCLKSWWHNQYVYICGYLWEEIINFPPTLQGKCVNVPSKFKGKNGKLGSKY